MKFTDAARERERADALGVPGVTDTENAALTAMQQAVMAKPAATKRRSPFRLAAMARLNPMTMGQSAADVPGGMR